MKLLLACFKFTYDQNLLLLSLIDHSSNDNFYNKVNFRGHKFLAESFNCVIVLYILRMLSQNSARFSRAKGK